MELLVEFDRVCRKHDLKYFLIYGTLLGAIRHHGFIPWDDDVDVGMPREDYEKLISLKDEFKQPLFLQHHSTDPEYCASYTRIRNTNTTAISKLLKYQNMNHGIFLDVFPFDNTPGIEKENRHEIIDSLNRENGTYMRLKNPDLDEKNRIRVKNYSGNPTETLKKIDEISTQFNGTETEYTCSIVNTMGKFDFFKKEDVFNTILWDYEGFKFPVPAGYDNVLKEIFGNYMELPPIEKRGVQHSHYIFDPDQPFKNYL
jgi:lipopolysaccharide cholinephosphotransferase